MRSEIFQRVLDNTPKEVELFVDYYVSFITNSARLLHNTEVNKDKYINNKKTL